MGHKANSNRSGDVHPNPGPRDLPGDLADTDDTDDRDGEREQERREVQAGKKSKKVDLQVITYNVRGLSESKKLRHLINILYKRSKDASNSIYLLQEVYSTKLDLVRYLWRGEYHLTPGLGNSQGCLTMLTAPYKIISATDIGNRAHVLVLAKDDPNKADLIVVNAYAPNGFGPDKFQFFDEILDNVNDMKNVYNCENIIIGGDLNLVLCEEETKNRVFSQPEKRAADMLKNVLRSLNLTDGWEIARRRLFTWGTTRLGVQTYSTLDRIAFNENYLTLSSKVTDWSLSVSDHAAVISSFNKLNQSANRSRLSCRLDPQILLDNEGRELIDEAFCELRVQESPDWNPHVRLEYLKMCLRTAANVAIGKTKARVRDLESTLNSDINDLVNQLSCDNPGDDRELLMHKLDDLRLLKRGLVEKIGSKLAQRSARKWYNEGELSNKYFFNLLNRKTNDEINIIIRENGEEVTDSKLVQEEIKTFYKNLYESVPDQLIINDDIFRNITPKEERDARALTERLTLEELEQTLATCKDSSPGPDGIPYSFLKHFWKVMGPAILAAWQYSLDTGELPPSHKLSYLRLIPKAGKDPRIMTNLRPITLSNTDHKLITKTYSRKLTKLVAPLISEEQTAYIPGRLINDNVRALLMTIDLADLDPEIDGALISLDAKKAFDSVDHRFIKKTLEAFGFANFIPVFEVLYKDLKSDIIINGNAVDGYKILKGVKQGDALSCILFIMCVEPLLRNINENRRIARVESAQLNIVLPKTCGFADDVTVITRRSNANVAEVFKVYEEFTNASGLMLNADKTEIMCFNQARNINHQFAFDYCHERFTINAVEKLKINGIIFMQDPRRREAVNVAKSLESMERLLRSWSTRQLTLIGKILIIKTFAVSQSIYLMQSMSLGEVSLKAIEKLIYKFLWNKNFNANKAPDRIKRKIMETPTAFGGFGMINVRSLNDSLNLRSFARLIKSNHPFFKQILSLIDSKDPFNVKINAPVDVKLMCAIKAVNRNRSKMLELRTEEILINAGIVSLLNNVKLKDLLSMTGLRSVPFFLIHRRAPDCAPTRLTEQEFRSIERFIKYPQLNSAIRALIASGLNAPLNVPIDELYLRKSKACVSICSLSSKAFRLNEQNDEDTMICIYKSGLILNPGELTSWTNQTRKLTSSRHKNTLLRVAHGDVFSNDRLHRFGLKDNPNCSNCDEPNESPIHRILECPAARRTWALLEEIKPRLGLNQLSDLSIENLLGAKDRLNKIELALQAEVLLKLISNGDRYEPKRLVNSSLKVISYCERLEADMLGKLKNELQAI